MSSKFHLKDKISLLVRPYALLGVRLLTSSRNTKLVTTHEKRFILLFFSFVLASIENIIEEVSHHIYKHFKHH